MGARGKGPVQQKILRLLADGEPRTCREIGEAVGLPPGAAHNHVQALYRFGYDHDDELVTPVGVGPLNARTYTITNLGRTFLP